MKNSILLLFFILLLQLVHPLEVVRRLKQIDKTNENGAKLKQTSLTVLRSLWKEGGITRLYAGITASYLKVIPTAAISLIVRDAVLGRLGDDDQKCHKRKEN